MKRILLFVALSLAVAVALADFTEGPGDEGDDMMYPPGHGHKHHRNHHHKGHGRHLRKGKHCDGKFPKLAISVGESRPCIFVTERLDIYDTCQLDHLLLPGEDFKLVNTANSKELIFRAATKVETSKCADTSDDTAVCLCDGDDCEAVGYGYTQTWKELRPTKEEIDDEDDDEDEEQIAGIDLTYHSDEKCGDGFRNYTIRYECDFDALDDAEEGEEVSRALTFNTISEKQCETLVQAKTIAACPLRGKQWIRAAWIHMVLSFLFWACCCGMCCNIFCLLPMCMCCSGGRKRRTRVRVMSIPAPAPSVATGCSSVPTPMYTAPKMSAPLAQPAIKNGYVPLPNPQM